MCTMSLHYYFVSVIVLYMLILFVNQKSRKDTVKNYRPLSLISVYCKVPDSIIKDHIVKYFLQNNLFMHERLEFPPGRSSSFESDCD